MKDSLDAYAPGKQARDTRLQTTSAQANMKCKKVIMHVQERGIGGKRKPHLNVVPLSLRSSPGTPVYIAGAYIPDVPALGTEPEPTLS